MDTLDDTEKQILSTLASEGSVRGNVLRRKTRIKNPKDMVDAVHHLMKLELIAANGSVSDASSLMSARLSIVPSSRSFTKDLLKKSM